MSVEYDYDDGFIRLCNLIGGEEYTKISKALLNNPNSTDEEIAGGTGLKVNIVRKALYDLFGRSLITGIRVRDVNRGWFVYKWKADTEHSEIYVTNQKEKSLKKLQQKIKYYKANDFYKCDNPTCETITFQEALDQFFKCSSCGTSMNAIDKKTLVKALNWKKDQIQAELIKQIESDKKKRQAAESKKLELEKQEKEEIERKKQEIIDLKKAKLKKKMEKAKAQKQKVEERKKRVKAQKKKVEENKKKAKAQKKKVEERKKKAKAQKQKAEEKKKKIVKLNKKNTKKAKK